MYACKCTPRGSPHLSSRGWCWLLECLAHSPVSTQAPESFIRLLKYLSSVLAALLQSGLEW